MPCYPSQKFLPAYGNQVTNSHLVNKVIKMVATPNSMNIDPVHTPDLLVIPRWFPDGFSQRILNKAQNQKQNTNNKVKDSIMIHLKHLSNPYTWRRIILTNDWCFEHKNSHLIAKWLFCVSHVAFLVVYLQHYQCP